MIRSATLVRSASVAVVCLVGLTCAGCSGKSGPGKVVTITVPPSSSAPASGSGTGSGSPTTSAAPAAETSLPGTCDDLLTDYAVAQAANGGYTLGGTTSFVVGVPEKDIGRLANINCRYGVSGSGATQKRKVEIGVSLYSTAAQAAARIAATASDYEAHGAQATPVTVDGQQGQYLTGGSGADYADPTLVVADGQRTIAVTVTSEFATGTAAQTAASKVAALAAKQTG